MVYKEVELKFDEIDRQVIEILSKSGTVRSDIAIDTYKFGLILRQLALDGLEKKEQHHNTKIITLLKNEPVIKAIILIIISLLRMGYKPLIKLFSKKG